MIDLKIDISGLLAMRANLNNLADKQVDFATSRSMNAGLFAARDEMRKEIGRVFDNPTPWVRGAGHVVKTKRDRLRGSLSINLDGNKQGVTVGHVLAAEISGGLRKNKRHEIALQRVGVLPSGMAIVPGPAAKLDAYGNMSAGQITQIVSWFKGFSEQGYRANMRDNGKRLGKDNKKTGAKGFAYFALQRKRGRLIPGIYQRFSFAHGSAVKPVMFFVRMPSYKRRLDFYGIAERVARDEFNKQFPLMLADAMRTAK